MIYRDMMIFHRRNIRFGSFECYQQISMIGMRMKINDEDGGEMCIV